MISIRRAAKRGVTKLDWLDSRHTFSFADYYDREHMGFGQLRVINEDRVQPGRGFPSHDHRDMEIISYVLEGALEHKDSLGSGSVIRPGEVQRMSAGRGITHSEFNPSRTDTVHFLQIWILPEQPGMAPGYEQQAIDLSAARGKFHVVASKAGGQGSVTVLLEPGDKLIHPLAGPGRHAWVQLARGAIALNGDALAAGDGAAIVAESELRIEADNTAEVLLFDLA